jgi:chromosome segregation ATPase
MKEQLQQRLQSLKAEFEAGKKMLADLESQQVKVRETVLRISGAIQVLEEELAKADSTENGSASEPLKRIEPLIEMNDYR